MNSWADGPNIPPSAQWGGEGEPVRGLCIGVQKSYVNLKQLNKVYQYLGEFGPCGIFEYLTREKVVDLYGGGRVVIFIELPEEGWGGEGCLSSGH